MKTVRPLNLKHLRYFAEVARRGSVTAAAKFLYLTPQTISGQIQELEASIDQPLFDRVGKRMRLTHAGETALDYAKAIFALGEELNTVLRGAARARSIVLRIGITDSIAKLQTISTLLPVIERHRNALELICQEGPYADLVGRVGAGELDMLLSDSPASASLARSLHIMTIADTGLSFMGSASLCARLKGTFPRNLDDMPFLAASSSNSALMQSLEMWFARHEIRPRVVGRIDDSALLKGLAQQGFGIAAVPTSIERDVARQYRLKVIGREKEVRLPIYLVRARGRRIHPLVAEIESLHSSGRVR